MAIKRKKKAKKRGPTDPMLYCELLQNGETIAAFSKSLKRSGRVRIGGNKNCELFVPFYNHYEDLEVLEFGKGEAKLSLGANWEGWATTKGTINDHVGTKHKPIEMDLVLGDYASFASEDLLLLIRIAKPPKSAALVKSDPKYRPGLFSLLVGQAQDFNILLAGVGIATLVFAPAIYVLSVMHDSRPKNFSELTAEYMHPFFHPKHLENAPELQQQNINRSNYHLTTLKFINALTGMFMGWSAGFDPKFTFASSRIYYEGLFKLNKKDIDQRIAQQQHIETKMLAKPRTAIVSIPAVVGESVPGSLLRMFDKFDTMHESAEMMLPLRRQIVEDFKNDDPYDEKDFKNTRRLSDNARKALAKIKPFELLTNEEQMYADTKALAKKAKLAQARIHTARAGFESVETNQIIGIPAGVTFASFVYNANALANDGKINDIIASQYEKREVVKIKEPLIGEIEPQLIEKMIASKRYELQLCFELAMRRGELNGGRMEWSWRIDSRGKISDIALLSSSINDNHMVRCVRQKIAEWKFPRPRRGSVEVRYPFQFSRGNG